MMGSEGVCEKEEMCEINVTVHGKRAHLTRTFFSRFFIRAGCSETALQNDAICSDVTRSTRALYAQIARVAGLFTSKVYFRSNSVCVITRACA